MKRVIVAFLFLFASLTCTNAASRFWNPYSVTGAISGTGGVCRLTITPAIVGSGIVAGTSVIVTGITGITGCNVTTTISTVVDTTHVELTGTTFGGAGFGGTACMAGGIWTATNTATCGSGGSSVPVSTDGATLDANSKGGTVIPSFGGGTITLTSFDAGAFTGTLDFSVNNDSITATGSGGIGFSGTGTRTINLGNGTFTVSNSTGGPQFSTSVGTNLTFNAGGSTIALTGTGTQSFNLGTQTANIVSIGSRTSGLGVSNSSANGHTIKTLTITAPNLYKITTAGITSNIQTALNVTGDATNQVIIQSGVDANVQTISSAAALTCTYCAFRDITFTGGGTLRATSSLDLGDNTGITFGSSSACILGGWLLWRDMPEHLNDNFPAWLEKAG